MCIAPAKTLIALLNTYLKGFRNCKFGRRNTDERFVAFLFCLWFHKSMNYKSFMAGFNV